MKKVIFSIPGDQTLPLPLRSRFITELPDKALFKGISLVCRIPWMKCNPFVNVSGKPLFEPLHDPHVHKGAGHDLLDEYVPGQNMEYLGSKFIPGILHGSIDMPQHNIRF